MRDTAWNDQLLAAFREFIRSQNARQAFDLLVEAAIKLRTYRCRPNDAKGPKKAFIYDDAVSGARRFAFIVNREHLLFYVRKEGIRYVAGGLRGLQAVVPSAAENNAGEWTVRIETPDQARRLHAFLFRSVDKDGVTREAGRADRQRLRTEPEYAGKILERIFARAPPDARHDWEVFLADSIQYAATKWPDRWVVALHRDYLRFIVGMVLCIQFHPKHGVTVLVLRNKAPRGLKLLGREYKHAPGCEEALIPFAGAETIISRIREASRSAIGICAAAHAGNGAFRRAHSPGVVRYLEQALGRKLSDPSYSIGGIESATGEVVGPDESRESVEINGDLGTGTARGQGRESDPRIRRAVEFRAMDVARAYYEDLGYSVKDTSLHKPYDYVISKDGITRRVEVKGTQGDCVSVLVTAGEVNAALTGPEPMDLFVLSGIGITGRDGEVFATGGRRRIVDNWRPKEADLVAKVFLYSLAASER